MAILGMPHTRAVDFARDIRPILSDHCFQCHGPDEKERAAEMRLDTQEGILYAFAQGEFDESEAWRRIHAEDPDEQMPPPEFRKPLSATQIQLLQQWMNQQAPWSQHWAFAQPVHQDPPAVPGATHPIDRFIVARLREEGLEPSPQAARATLIRRLKFDLLGLPPTLEEIEAFIADDSPDAYEKLVDQLLASPHFGERMAIEWLDGARYADTNGYQNDFKRSMWPWRDWVINAFNENLPYDRFTIEQLAGDMLSKPTLQQRIATGFNRNHRTVTEAGSIPDEWLVENVVDRVETTATVFLGLTMGCARCHDHKYDPISQREFYQFFSFFHNVKELGVYQETRGNVAPLQPVLPPEELSKIDAIREQLATAKSKHKEMQVKLPGQAEAWSGTGWLQADAPQIPDSQFRLQLDGSADATLADGKRFSPIENSGKFGWLEGVFGVTAKFTGLHKLSYGQAIAPDRETPFTLAFWVRPNKMGSILDKIDLDQTSRGFDIYWQNKGQLEMHLIHAWPQDAIKVRTKQNIVPKGQWSHVAFSYDGSSKAAGIKLYVNGEQVSLIAKPDQLQNSFAVDEPLRIGRRSRGFDFFGSLSDLRYYDEQLGTAPISEMIRQGLIRLFAVEWNHNDKTLRERRDSLYANFSHDPFASELRELAALINDLENELKARETATPTVMVMEELPEPRPTYVLTRGEYDKPDKSQPVTADIPEFLGTISDRVKKDRLALAKWMVSPNNPLTARVRVNRLWAMLFGEGLVKTTENFGVQAEPPTHPKLLDWLATEFVRVGWDTKGLLKLIVTSDTYRQSSKVTAQLAAQDLGNTWYARGPRFRLPAELVRDNALAISGLLTAKVGGESIRPYQPEKLWDELAGGAGEGPYVQSKGDDLYRRSLYIYRKRTVPHPTTSTFDAPSFEICQVKRARTNTPLQALALLNDVTYVEAARRLGERMLSEGGENDPARLAYGFRLATGRQASDVERATLISSYARKRELFGKDAGAATRYISHGESKSTLDVPVEQLAAYTSVASILLNLDETITKE